MALTKYFEATWLPEQGIARYRHERTLRYRFNKRGPLDPEPILSWDWQDEVRQPGDFVCTVDVVRLVSPLVREIFDGLKTEHDDIQWIPGTLALPSGEELEYWVPHFPSPDDILDMEHTNFGPSGLPIRYVFSYARLVPHAITKSASSSSTVVLSEPVVNALRAAGTRNIMYMPAPVNYPDWS